ncbi:hypothetical protein ACA910_012198 [Epithemia clementina (nom. ined.)]
MMIIPKQGKADPIAARFATTRSNSDDASRSAPSTTTPNEEKQALIRLWRRKRHEIQRQPATFATVSLLMTRIRRRMQSFCIIFRQMKKFMVTLTTPQRRQVWLGTARRFLIGVLLVLLTSQSLIVRNANAATTTSSMGLLSQTTDLPQLTLSSEPLELPESYDDDMMLTTTSRVNAVRVTKILTASGTVLLAAAGGVMLGRSLLDSATVAVANKNNNGSNSNNQKPFSKPESKRLVDKNNNNDNSKTDKNPTSTTKTTAKTKKTRSSSSSDGFESYADLMLVRNDFEKIRRMENDEKSKLDLAQSLLSEINGTVAQSSLAVQASVDIMQDTGSGAGGVGGLFGSGTSFWGRGNSNNMDNERKEQARRKVETILAEIDKAEKTAVNWKQERMELKDDMNATKNRVDVEEPVTLPPPVEETKFAGWLNAMDDDYDGQDDNYYDDDDIDYGGVGKSQGAITEKASTAAKQSAKSALRNKRPKDFYFAEQRAKQAKANVTVGSSKVQVERDHDDVTESPVLEDYASPITKEEIPSSLSDEKTQMPTAKASLNQTKASTVSAATTSTTEDKDADLEKAFAKMGVVPTVGMMSKSALTEESSAISSESNDVMKVEDLAHSADEARMEKETKESPTTTDSVLVEAGKDFESSEEISPTDSELFETEVDVKEQEILPKGSELAELEVQMKEDIPQTELVKDETPIASFTAPSETEIDSDTTVTAPEHNDDALPTTEEDRLLADDEDFEEWEETEDDGDLGEEDVSIALDEEIAQMNEPAVEETAKSMSDMADSRDSVESRNKKQGKSYLPSFLKDSSDQTSERDWQSNAEGDIDDTLDMEQEQQKPSFSFFSWANRNIRIPKKDGEIDEEEEVEELVGDNGQPEIQPQLGLQRSPKRAEVVEYYDDDNETDYVSFKDAIDYKNPSQETRPYDEEEYLKRKYGAIQDIGERAYQILVDLGMVRPFSLSSNDEEEEGEDDE